MDRYVSSFTKTVDGKGRVSIPAPFRLVLARDGGDTLFVTPALDVPALDCGGERLMDQIGQLLERFPSYSDERDHLSAALLGDCDQLRVDGDGRIVLSEEMKAHAGIDGEVVLVGVGHKFQMWAPGNFAVHRAEARAKARELKRQIGLAPREPDETRE